MYMNLQRNDAEKAKFDWHTVFSTETWVLWFKIATAYIGKKIEILIFLLEETPQGLRPWLFKTVDQRRTYLDYLNFSKYTLGSALHQHGWGR